MYIYTHTIQLNELISPKLLLLAPFKPIKKKKIATRQIHVRSIYDSTLLIAPDLTS